jgi:hypothetical protein
MAPAWETYYQQLIPKGYEHALWDADQGKELAVEIADVGYLFEGLFVWLFNASKEPGDQCTQHSRWIQADLNK